MDISKFTDTGKLKGKEAELKKLAESADGQKIRAAVDGEKLKKAFDEGDTEAMQSVVKSVLQTQEGARLLKQLEQMFK